MRCRWTALAAAWVLFLSVPLAAVAADGEAELTTPVPGMDLKHLLALSAPDRVEFCGEPLPLEREDVRERLELELLLQLGNAAQTALWMKRMPRHFPMIEALLATDNLPEDLKYVAVVESNLRPDALSRAGASGPWQFMRGTGRICGLEQTRWKDERCDWEKSTRSAAGYLKDLHDEFGTWPLALAAYNLGRGRLKQLMKEQRQEDYFGLELPSETERYVFRIVAVKLLTEQPERFGIDPEEIAHFPDDGALDAMVHVTHQALPIAVVAELAGTSYRYFLRLNPWLRGKELPRGAHWLRIPPEAADALEMKVAAWEKENPEPTVVHYKVQSGDTLSAIARRHDVSLSQLLAVNSLKGSSIIRPGQRLVVPVAD